MTTAVSPTTSTPILALLVEDDARLAALTKEYLEGHGVAVVHVGDGRRGQEEALGGRYDAVLLDLMLPGMDGLEVCRLIRRQTSTAKVPVIIVSARAEEIDLVLGLEMGADDYVVKPFRFSELAARCKAALRRSAARAGPAAGYVDESFDVDFEGLDLAYVALLETGSPGEVLRHDAGVLDHGDVGPEFFDDLQIGQDEQLRVLNEVVVVDRQHGVRRQTGQHGQAE